MIGFDIRASIILADAIVTASQFVHETSSIRASDKESVPFPTVNNLSPAKWTSNSPRINPISEYFNSNILVITSDSKAGQLNNFL